MKKIYLIAFIISGFLASCNYENGLEEISNQKQTIHRIDEQKTTSLNQNEGSYRYTSESNEDYLKRKKLIDLEAELYKCLGHPFFNGSTLQYPEDFGTSNIDTKSDWETFEANFPKSPDGAITTFGASYGAWLSLDHFNLPIFRTVEAVPSLFKLRLMISVSEDFTMLPCHTQYLKDVMQAIYYSKPEINEDGTIN